MGFAGYGLMGVIIALLGGSLLLLVVFFKMWKEFVKMLVLLGPPSLYNFVMGVRKVVTTGEWGALVNAFWPPAGHWDTILASNFKMGISGLFLWWVFAVGLAGWLTHDWLGRIFPKLRIKKSWRFLVAIPLTIPIMILLGGGLPNASRILPSLLADLFIAFLRVHYVIWTVIWSFVVLGAFIALLSGIFGGQTVYVKKEEAPSEGNRPRTEEHIRTIKTLPTLPKSEWKPLESAASGEWRQKRQYPNARLLVKDLGVSSVVAGRETATLVTDQGRGEVIHTEAGNFLIYL